MTDRRTDGAGGQPTRQAPPAAGYNNTAAPRNQTSLPRHGYTDWAAPEGQPSGQQGRRKSGLLAVKIILAAIVLTAVFAALFVYFGKGDTEQHIAGASVVVNEIMADNRSTLADGDGDYSDWIELYNNGDVTVVFDGYYLSDSMSDPYKWALPAISLDPGQYLIIFASGKDKCDEAGSYHTNFRLSASGEEVVLTNPERLAASTAQFGPSVENISYGRVRLEDGSYGYGWLESPSPGAENCTTYAASAYDLPSSISGVVINEVMTDNTYTIHDSEGNYCDWVELYNTTLFTISLDGCALSDNPAEPDRWIFPDGTEIKAGGYLLVYLSGRDTAANGELHTSFGLGAQDTSLVLSDSLSRRIDIIDLPELKPNVSYGRGEGGTMRYFATATPGRENSTVSFELLSAAASADNRLRINEASAASVEKLTGAALADWIELYNPTEDDISLSGYGLSNRLEERFRFTFGEVAIPAGGFLVIDCTGVKAGDGEAPFKIDCSGEELYLSDPEGNVIDYFDTGKLRIGLSSGRGAEGNRVYYTTPTKGCENSAHGLSTYVSPPAFSSEGGYVSRGFSLKITASEGAVIRYTTDGSDPDESSPVYSRSVKIEESVTVKARAYAEGSIPSDVVFATFLIEEEHTVPVVCISTDEAGLYSKQSGIIEQSHDPGDTYPYMTANFWQDWERQVTFEYFIDGIKQVSFNAGIKVAGQYTRAYPQNSFAVHIRDIYGASSVCYPFFGNGITEHSTLVLRNSGQDLRLARLRDAFMGRLSLSSDTALIAADSQPVALYINGEYYGLCNMREKLNEDYLSRNLGADKGTLDIIKGNKAAIAGDMDDYQALCDYLDTHSMAIEEYYDYVCTQVDLDSCMDFIIFSVFAVNDDPGNVKVYKDGAEGGKWHWFVYDFDMSLRHRNHKDSIDYALTYRSSYIFRHLLDNREFEQLFIERFAYHLNTTFAPEHTVPLWDSMAQEIEDEIERQYDRWDFPSPTKWAAQVEFVRQVLTDRRDQLKEQLIDYFDLSRAEADRLFPNG